MHGRGVEKGMVVAASGEGMVVTTSGVMEMLAGRHFEDVGARANGSTLCLPAPLVKEDLTFQPTDKKTVCVD